MEFMGLTRPSTHLDELSRYDVQSAFRHAYDAMDIEQQKLRCHNPNNPFLDLIRLHGDRQGCAFSDNFKSIVMEHTAEEDIPRGATLYYFIGRYIELLREEHERPKFPSADTLLV